MTALLLLQCMSLLLAPNGHATVVASCPFIGVEQTSGSYGAMSESDPAGPKGRVLHMSAP